MIGLSHPGKSGDILYSVPAMKWLCDKHNTVGDFYTAALGPSLRKIFEYQYYINEYVVCGEPSDFWGGWGVQPWDLSSYMDNREYEAVYQFGFRNYPNDQVHRFYLTELGIHGVTPELIGTWEYPELESTEYTELANTDYVVIAPRGDMDFYGTYMSAMDLLKIPAVQIGHPSEWFDHPNALNYTNVDWLYELSILSHAKGFIGPISSKGALAHNFDFPKVYVTHLGYGAGIGQLPLTPTTHLLIQEEQGKTIAGERILERMGLI